MIQDVNWQDQSAPALGSHLKPADAMQETTNITGKDTIMW